jgi:hypothetical protein
MNPQLASRFEDLLSPQVETFPYDYPLLFSTEGWWARRRSRQRFRLLKGIDPKLREVLREDERVYFITTGTTVSLGEQFFVGWLAYYLNRRALVFTTERILFVAIDRRHRARALLSQIPYAALASVRTTWNGLCRIKLVNRETYHFQGVPRADRKFLAGFLSDILQGTNAPFQRVQGFEHLCPFCATVVPGHPDRCPFCTGVFKSPRTAALRSLGWPGLGDWYLGHRAFAGFEMAGNALLWLLLVVLPLALPPTEEYPGPDAGYWISAAMVLAVAHAVDAAVTWHFALKGHHPEGPPPDRVPRPPVL